MRERLLAARRLVPDDIRAAECRSLVEHVKRVVGGDDTVCAYVPVGTEPGSIDMLDALLPRVGRLLLPIARMGADGSPVALQWGEYRPGELVTARFGLLEPREQPGVTVVCSQGGAIPSALMACRRSQ